MTKSCRPTLKFFSFHCSTLIRTQTRNINSSFPTWLLLEFNNRTRFSLDSPSFLHTQFFLLSDLTINKLANPISSSSLLFLEVKFCQTEATNSPYKAYSNNGCTLLYERWPVSQPQGCLLTQLRPRQDWKRTLVLRPAFPKSFLNLTEFEEKTCTTLNFKIH